MLAASLTHSRNDSAYLKTTTMKKQSLILTVALLLTFNFVKSQITLDTLVFPQIGYIGHSFKPVQISETETKYFWADTVTNTFSLLNMDWTPFISNISVPLPFGPYDYQCLYITRSLFDCDSTNIEYLYTAPTGGGLDRKIFVMRTDGTQLFQIDSAFCQYCFGGCLGGSDWVKPIENTSAGAKMFVIKTQTPGVYVYSLCGSVPVNIFDFTSSNNSFLKLYPNPTSSSVTFLINPPDNSKVYDLVIFDNQAKVLSRTSIPIGENKMTINVSDFSSGSYFYSLCTKEKSFQTGKFILTK